MSLTTASYKAERSDIETAQLAASNRRTTLSAEIAKFVKKYAIKYGAVAPLAPKPLKRKV